MDSTPNKDRLLDLLYGELSPEEDAELRRAIANDEELAQQWRELQATREEIAEHLPQPVDLPVSVRETILEAAAEHTEEASAGRRDGRRANSTNLWTVMASGKVQAAASAALVVGVSVVAFLLYGDRFGMEDTVPMTEEMAMAPQEVESVAEEPQVDDAEAVAESDDRPGAWEFFAQDKSAVDGLDEGDDVSSVIAQADIDKDAKGPAQDRMERREQRVHRGIGAREAEVEAEDEDTDQIISLLDDSTPPARSRAPRPRPQPEPSPRDAEPSAEIQEDSAPALDLGSGAELGTVDGSSAGRSAGGAAQQRTEEVSPAAPREPEADDQPEGPTETDEPTEALAAEVTEKEAEQDTDEESDDSDEAVTEATRRLEAAIEAGDDGDVESARQKIQSLYDDEMVDELDEPSQQELQRLERSLPAPGDGEIMIFR